ncbi:MAG TPA: SMP-30/gluconolactonase/LRE family protein [Steroidobacteraceae bacterium]|jgi:sugar lactone lactonase YvrE|nr:SMP-30/gluconolactonase/LRE family protein [Steroidobacteraceae bacterium]
MSDDVATLEIDCRNELGEAPLWCATSETLYWADVAKPGRVFHWQTAGRRVDFWDFADLVTGLNLIDGGGLLVHAKDRILSFDPDSGESRPVFSLRPTDPPMRFNDGHCDRAGRLWVGTMPNNISESGAPLNIAARNGRIYAIGKASFQATDADLGCPNAICWSPDDSTFYIADSCDGWLYSYRFDGSTGTISDRRPFCHLDGFGVPDGGAVDCDGYLWNARWGAGVVVRISPDGVLDRVIRLPVSQPTSCCFGDRKLRTLYITSARFALTAEQLRAEPLAGGVFSVRLDVAGIAKPKFIPGSDHMAEPL